LEASRNNQSQLLADVVEKGLVIRGTA
jgi:hypothetical protein